METILIVDDEPFIRELLQSEYEMEGYQVKIAANAEDALAVLNSDESIRIVLSDICMPAEDGVELLARIKAMPARKIHVMLISGFSDFKREEVIKKGACELFPKPFDFEEILQFTNALAKK